MRVIVSFLLVAVLGLAAVMRTASAAPFFGPFAITRRPVIKYKLVPDLGFSKYQAVHYQPLVESPAEAPEFVYTPGAAPAYPYPEAVEGAAAAYPYPAPSGQYL